MPEIYKHLLASRYLPSLHSTNLLFVVFTARPAPAPAKDGIDAEPFTDCPDPPSYGRNGRPVLNSSDRSWRHFFQLERIRWVRFILWTTVRALPSSSRAILTSRHQSNSDPYILFFEAPRGLFIAVI